jgi:outer membrane protein OmpA-like peptidoglycan-associated protein
MRAFTLRAVLTASMLLIAPLSASAGEATYTAEEVVEFFGRVKDLGPERGICVGTVEECATAIIEAETFDLLVTFELNSDRLSDEAKDNLRQFLKAIEDPRLANANFAIEGHTDATGPEPYNQQLSERRAEAVVKFLREQGADTSRFLVKGFGEANPRVEDPYDPVNRRVETRIVE